MRPIKESTYNAIKSQNMTGANTFKHKIVIDGEPDRWGPFGSLASKSLSTGYYGDITERIDGKILTTWRRGGSEIMLSVVNSEADFSTDNVAETGAWVHETLPQNHGSYERNSSLLTLKDGRIILFVYNRGTSAIPSWIKCYISNNGLGTDFVGATVYTYPLRANVSINDNGIGKPMQTSSGAVILPFIGGWNYDSGYSFRKAAVLRSTNLIDWANISIRASLNYAGDRFISLCEFDTGTGKKLAGLIPTEDGSGSVYIYESTNDGLSFSHVGSWSGTSRLHSSLTSGLDDYVYMMINTTIYRRLKSNAPLTVADYDPTNWELVLTFSGYQSGASALLNFSKNGTVSIVGWIGGISRILMSFRKFIDSKFKAQSITISKSHGGASTATIQVDNKKGVVNPRNPEGPLYGVLNLNKQIIIEQGYGDDLVPSFTGIIDGINMSTFPQVANISLRDNFKKALDQIVTKAGSQVVSYTTQPIETIVADLCTLCGLSVGYIEPTGISIEKTFSWQSYADAFSFLSDLASFEYLCDETGKFHFRRDFQPGDMYVAWSFNEGEDITGLTYAIDDSDLYRSVRVYGQSGENVLVYNAPFLDAAEFNILPQKVLKIDATETSTTAELRKIAERAIATMRSRTRVIEFSAIAIPHLQVGDFIQIFESSTNSHEIYRLSSIDLTMDSKSFTMRCKAYYYGDSIVPGELPTDTESQTPDETLNLIPEMTSNTAPSGVARSSSVYTLYGVNYSPWRAFNTDDTDYFWDASTKAAWIEYEFPKKTIVDKYAIKSRQDLVWNKALPKDWTFQAYDGEKWITLDTRTNQTAWQIYEWRSYKVTNTTPYAKYRLSVSANNGYIRTQIEQLAMYYTGGV